MHTPQPRMVISSLWFQTSLLTFIVGFAVMGYLAIRISFTHPPIPARVVAPGGQVLFTGDDVMAGQHIFQRYGLMQLGTLFGHGAYLGPDFTAQYLHRAAQIMTAFHEGSGLPHPEAAAQVQQEFKANVYDPTTGTLPYTARPSAGVQWSLRVLPRVLRPAEPATRHPSGST